MIESRTVSADPISSKPMSAGELEDALRDAGVRITRQRSAILRTLADADDHPDANELFQRASEIEPTVSLSTVYRTLSVLEDKGVILRLSFEGAPARFETADSPHHDHMIDLETGDVIEFRSEKIERLQAEIAAELGYDIVYHKLELYGRKKKRA
ncbi:Fur family transcriptional regulator [Roseitalea porphyridii]|jgi:Fur family ferric uptake transcriptional regulator